MKNLIINKKMSILLLIYIEIDLILRSFIYLINISDLSYIVIILITLAILLLRLFAETFFIIWLIVFLCKSKKIFINAPVEYIKKDVYIPNRLFFTAIISITLSYCLFLFLDSKTYNLIGTKAIYQTTFYLLIFFWQILYITMLQKAEKLIGKEDKNRKHLVECKYIKDKNGNIAYINLFSKGQNLKELFTILRVIPPFSLFFDTDKTIDTYKEIAEKEDDDGYYMIIAAQYAQKNDFENALNYINKAIEINENDADCFEFKGNLLFMMENYEEALSCLLKAEEKNKLEIDSLVEISIIYTLLDDSVNAFQYSQKALEINKKYGDALYAQALVFYTANNCEHAYSLFKEAKRNNCTYKALDEYLDKLSYFEDAQKSMKQDFFE